VRRHTAHFLWLPCGTQPSVERLDHGVRLGRYHALVANWRSIGASPAQAVSASPVSQAVKWIRCVASVIQYEPMASVTTRTWSGSIR
jgi:hypothetical protein